MIITNKHGLPEPVFNAIKYGGRYEGGGDLSVTTIIDSPTIYRLKKTYESQIHMDVSEMVWALLGSAVHFIIENAKLSAPDRFITERRMFLDCNGTTVSGKMDLIDIVNATYNEKTNTIENADLYDYKVSSVWASIFGLSEKKSWVKQTNTYAAMAEVAGLELDTDIPRLGLKAGQHVKIKCKSANIVLIMRDWASKDAKYNKDYPKTQIECIPVPMYKNAEAMIDWVKGRVELFTQDEPMPCTDEEMWKTPDVYAVKRDASSKAYNGGLFDEKNGGFGAAMEFYNDKIAGGYPAMIEQRTGEYRRCSKWCVAREFCQRRIDLGIPIE